MCNVMVGKVLAVVLILVIVVLSWLRFKVRFTGVMMVSNKLVAEQKSNGKED